jgi:hypothetical protein
MLSDRQVAIANSGAESFTSAAWLNQESTPSRAARPNSSTQSTFALDLTEERSPSASASTRSTSALVVGSGANISNTGDLDHSYSARLATEPDALLTSPYIFRTNLWNDYWHATN